MTKVKLPFTTAPNSICLLRLSALGDITHTLPIFHTIRQAWPDTKITWIIGKTEHELVKDLDGVEFIVFDKNAGLAGYKAVKHQLNNRKFDVLLHMQMSLRSSLVSLLVKSDIKLGFDKQRAKDLQWLFTNHKISHKEQQHVIDSFFGFTEALGIKEKHYKWDVPIPKSAREFASQYIKEQPTLVISPCSSKAYRNWNCEGYAAIADYAIEQHGMQVIITGGPSAIEKEYGQCIEHKSRHQLTNLVGKTSIKELLAILDRATVVIAPDSGPAHFCTAVDTPVIGLYATTNPDRARPYNSEKWLINRYPDAISKKYGQPLDELPWGVRVRDEGTMNLITVDDVKNMLDAFLA
jgi:heptosyltransferase I